MVAAEPTPSTLALRRRETELRADSARRWRWQYLISGGVLALLMVVLELVTAGVMSDASRVILGAAILALLKAGHTLRQDAESGDAYVAQLKQREAVLEQERRQVMETLCRSEWPSQAAISRAEIILRLAQDVETPKRALKALSESTWEGEA